jgi:hypothetical protein
VNWFPHSIVDRKLNSVEIIAGLQFAHHITGKALYREKAFELLYQHGYLSNIVSSMKQIAPTKGFIHQGNDMGDEWNHSTTSSPSTRTGCSIASPSTMS